MLSAFPITGLELARTATPSRPRGARPWTYRPVKNAAAIWPGSEPAESTDCSRQGQGGATGGIASTARGLCLIASSKRAKHQGPNPKDQRTCICFFFWSLVLGYWYFPSRRVVTARMERMAASDAAQPPDRPPQRPILPHGSNEIVAASRLEAAVTTQQRRDCPLVEPNDRDQHPTRQKPDGFCKRVHGVALRRGDESERRGRSGSSLFSMRAASERRDFPRRETFGVAPGRGMSTKSIAGNSCRARRNDSRSARFQRFRATLPPTARDTARPSRAWPSSFAAP